MTNRLESLQRKQSQIRAQIQQIQARERTKEKKKQTRRKFLVGEAILSEVESGRFEQADLISIMYRFLSTKNHINDKALFGLESQPGDETVGAGHVIVDIEFEKKSSTAVVEELLPTIEHYRSKGQTLTEIYAALRGMNLLFANSSSQISLGTFRNVYYKQRKEASIDPQSEQSKHSGVEEDIESEKPKQPRKARAESAVKKKRRRSIVKGSKAG